MSIKIKKHRSSVEVCQYFIEYRWIGELAGYLFPCDERGAIRFEDLSAEALQNYEKCETDERLEYIGLVRVVQHVKTSAIGQCYCGKDVSLDGLESECIFCGRRYNAIGEEKKS